MKRLRVLISSHELSPYMGSECAVGWNLVSRLGQYHDVTVIYAETNQFGLCSYKSDIERYIQENGPVPGIEFVSVPQSRRSRVFRRANRMLSLRESSTGFPPLFFWAYKNWQKAAYAKAQELMQEKSFDLVHLLTIVSYREPGYLWKLAVPFVWGPTSGTFNTPSAFVRKENIKYQLSNSFRTFSNFLKRGKNGRISKAVRKSSLIYAVSEEDRSFFQRYQGSRVKTLPDTGTLSVPASAIDTSVSGPLEIIWCGRMVASKGLNIFLKALAFSNFKEYDISVTIIGDGPLLEKNKQLAKSLKLKNIHWTGQISRDEVFERMKGADLLVHTSYKEAASSVITEALSFGTAILCHDAYGMSVVVDNLCGVKIPLVNPTVSIKRFSYALQDLVVRPETVLEMKEDALARAQELSWDSMAKRIATDYMEVVG